MSTAEKYLYIQSLFTVFRISVSDVLAQQTS